MFRRVFSFGNLIFYLVVPWVSPKAVFEGFHLFLIRLCTFPCLYTHQEQWVPSNASKCSCNVYIWTYIRVINNCSFVCKTLYCGFPFRDTVYHLRLYGFWRPFKNFLITLYYMLTDTKQNFEPNSSLVFMLSVCLTQEESRGLCCSSVFLLHQNTCSAFVTSWPHLTCVLYEQSELYNGAELRLNLQKEQVNVFLLYDHRLFHSLRISICVQKFTLTCTVLYICIDWHISSILLE